jgi:hypothetical protein
VPSGTTTFFPEQRLPIRSGAIFTIAPQWNSEDAMKLCRIVLFVITAACISTTGCARHPYYPPPPLAGAPPLIVRANREGFRAGSEEGARDRVNAVGYRPRRDREYRDTPGYDPALGPFGPYRDAFRNAYFRGYEQGYRRP